MMAYLEVLLMLLVHKVSVQIFGYVHHVYDGSFNTSFVFKRM